MGRLVRPVFGKPCKDCGEQVPQSRVRALEFANPCPVVRATILCIECQQIRENDERRFRRAEGPLDATILRRR